MAGEIIRMGDPTSHGGKVLEGLQTDICMGKPISYIGHKVQCPLCKGVFPIIEGVMTGTFYGKGVAVAGMKTACGATLIATQFTDTVEWSTGASGKLAAATEARSEAEAVVAAMAAADVALEVDEIQTYYTLTDENGDPVEGLKYDLYVDGKLHTKAGLYEDDGTTVKISGDAETRLVTWIDEDGAKRS